MNNNVIIKNVLLFLFCIIFLVSCKDVGKLYGDDIRLFKKINNLIVAVDKEDFIEITRIIRKKPDLLNYKEPVYGQTVLHWAVKNNKPISVKCLLVLGADPNAESVYNGETPLIAAASKNYGWEIVLMLIEHGAKVNHVAKSKITNIRPYSSTPLIASVDSRDIKIMKTLIDNGADINMCVEKENVLYRCINLGQVDMAKYLIVDKKVNTKTCIVKDANGDEITLDRRLKFFEHAVKGTSEYESLNAIYEYLNSN